MPLPKSTKTRNTTERTTLDVVEDFTRAAGQGLSFGFGDEIEAFVRSAVDSNASYADTLKEVRNKINEFRKRSPIGAYGTEIAGAIIPFVLAPFSATLRAGGAKLSQGASKIGLGKKGKSAVEGAATGALYGFGAGEGGFENRVQSGAISGAIGSVANPAIQAIAPRVTQTAKELIKKDVPVTAGQATRDSGLLGKGLARLEESVADNVFLIGDAVSGALQKSRQGFNKAAVQEALGPLVTKLPNLQGRALINYGQKVIKTNYDKTLGKMKLSNEASVNSEISKLTNDLPEEIKKDIADRVSRYITKKFVNGEMSGKNIKNAQTFLRRDIQRLTRGGSELEARKADALIDIKSVLSNELSKENSKLAKKLNDIDKAYGNFEIVRKASIKSAIKEGEFTPGDLLQETKKGDITKRKSNFSAGEARMQKLAQDAQNVIGNKVPDSGTSGRTQAARIVTGQGALQGATAIGDPLTTGFSAMVAPAMYSQLGVPITRGAVNLAGQGLQRSVPVTSANTQDVLASLLMNGT